MKGNILLVYAYYGEHPVVVVVEEELCSEVKNVKNSTKKLQYPHNVTAQWVWPSDG